jgi:hypothetical protein
MVAKGKARIVEFKPRTIDAGVRAAVLKALDEGYPFIMLAKAPDGEWEESCWLPPATNFYEVLGVLSAAQQRLGRYSGFTEDGD